MMLLKQLWVLLTCLGWALLSRAERPDDTSNGHDIIAKGVIGDGALATARTRCPKRGTTTGVRGLSVKVADSTARAILARAHAGARNECMAIIDRTDSSVVLYYSTPPSAPRDRAGRRVLSFGGGATVEVFAPGRGKIVSLTQ